MVTCELSTALYFKQTNTKSSYITYHEIQTLTVTFTFTDNNQQAQLLGHILNIPTGYLEAVNASSNVVPLALNMGGINFIKVLYDRHQGYKEAHILIPRYVDTALLGVIPCLRAYWKLGILHYLVVVIDFVERRGSKTTLNESK